MSYHVQQFDPQVFDLSLPSMFWREEPDASLVASLRAQGQLEPVIAEFSRSDVSVCAPLLLAGYKRVRALAALGLPVLARKHDLAGENGSDRARERGLIYLASNAGRPLDERLLFLALRYFSGCMHRDAMIVEVLPQLGLNARSRAWRLHAAWLDAPEMFSDALAEGRAPFALAETFDLHSSENLQGLAPFFATLKWSRGAAVNFVGWMGEVGAREGLSAAEIVSRAGLEEILHSGLSPKDMIEQLIGAVRSMRYPRLGQLERKTADLCQGLVTGTPWRAAHTRNFEDGSVSLSVSIKNQTQLDEAVQSLQSMADTSLWQRLWHMGEGKNG